MISRVMLIRSVAGSYTQLIGNSRHVSGVHSIAALEWNSKEKILAGKARQ